MFPCSAQLWKEVALCYKQMEDFERACDALLRARAYAKGAFAHFIASQLCLYVQRRGVLAAKAHIEAAIAAAPHDLRYYHFRAFIEAATKLEDTLPPDAPERAPPIRAAPPLPHLLTPVIATPEEAEAFHASSLQRELEDYEFVMTHPQGYDRIASIYNNVGAVYFEKRAHPRLPVLSFSDASARRARGGAGVLQQVTGSVSVVCAGALQQGDRVEGRAQPRRRRARVLDHPRAQP